MVAGDMTAVEGPVVGIRLGWEEAGMRRSLRAFESE